MGERERERELELDPNQGADLGDPTQIVSAVNHQVGSRVIRLRKSARLSRRELSERSGVSPRYLATLESGAGNISVGVLLKLATALNTPLGYFLADLDAQADGIQRMAQLFSSANSDTQKLVLDLLDPERHRAHKAHRVCLIGLRGAGKSTLAARMSKRFNAPFIELNDEIAKGVGMPVGEIIALYGQEGYRQLEADTLTRIIDENERAIVAVAGGLVSEVATFEKVLSSFHTVWVKASSFEHMERVRAQGDLRPMEGNPEAMHQLQEILKSREALHARADHTLDTRGEAVEASDTMLSEIITSHRMLG